MSHYPQNNDYLYTGGLAEFVPSPSPLTFSFFSHWFMGSTSFGKAMELLHLPYEHISVPLLEQVHGDVYLNLQHEEQTLYKNTFFTYKKQKSVHDTPQLSVAFSKMYNPLAYKNTIKMIIQQSNWIAHPDKTISFAQNVLQSIPQKHLSSIEAIDTYLKLSIWPVVIAIGLLSEFYYQLLKKESTDQQVWADLQSYISAEVGKNDWFLKSFTDQLLVKKESLSFQQYVDMYGIRADTDYELSCPRWNEIPKELEKRIETSHFPPLSEKKIQFKNNQTKQWTDAAIKLMILRSEAKKQALMAISVLRSAILAKVPPSDIANRERGKLLRNDFSPTQQNETHMRKQHIQHGQKQGKGIGVSTGDITGTTLHVTSLSQEVPPNTVCIFPNASPQFGQLFPKCKGMIFLTGGQTSHGAIVAREFGIPAIISSDAISLPNGETCHIQGSTGTWERT